MLLVLLILAIALYFIFTHHGVIQGHKIPNPMELLHQMGGGDDKPHFKVIFDADITGGKVVMTVSVFDEHNNMVHTQSFDKGIDIVQHVAKLRGTGRKIYHAFVARKDSMKKMQAYSNISRKHADQGRDVIMSSKSSVFKDVSCGRYYEDRDTKLFDKPVCNDFPKTFAELMSKPKPAKRELNAILKQLEELQRKPMVEPERDVDKALVLAKKLKEQDDATTKRVHQVRRQREELDKKLDEVKQDAVVAKKLETEEKIRTDNTVTQSLSIKQHIELTKKVLDNHNKRLEKLEGKLCGIGSEIRRGHAMLKSIKGKLDNDAKPDTKHQRFRKSNKASSEHKLRQLAREVQKDPKCPVCPMYADTHPVNVLEVTNQGFGSIVKDQ